MPFQSCVDNALYKFYILGDKFWESCTDEFVIFLNLKKLCISPYISEKKYVLYL